MALTNAEKQARWRERNNAFAKIGRQVKNGGYVTKGIDRIRELEAEVARLKDEIARQHGEPVQPRVSGYVIDKDGAELAKLKPQLERLVAEIDGDLTKITQGRKLLRLLRKARPLVEGPLVLNNVAGPDRVKAWNGFLVAIGTKRSFVHELEKIT
jgi:hypothetical protein